MRSNASEDRRLLQPYVAMQNLTHPDAQASSTGAGIENDHSSAGTGGHVKPTAAEHGPAFALAALQHPEIAAAINAAIIGVLHRYSTAQVPVNAQDAGTLQPIVRNNLFIITLVWTVLGLFLLFAATQAGSLGGQIATFTIYGIVQALLAIFILIVTTKQVKKVRKRSITLGYLMQGWLALVLCFAGLYLFFQNTHSLGLIVWDTDQLENAIGSAGTRATAFQGACLSVANSTAFVDYPLPDSAKQFWCQQVFESNFYTSSTTLIKIFHDFNVFLYFSIATMTSTGYGDIYPIGWASQFVVSLHMIVGWAYSAIIISKGISLFEHVDTKRIVKAPAHPNTRFRRTLLAVKNFVYQPDNQPAAVSLLSMHPNH